MIKLNDGIRDKIAAMFGILTPLTYLAGGREDSDGILFTYTNSGAKKVLKIIAASELGSTSERLRFAAYLGENGLPCACPNYNDDGSVYKTLREGKHLYIAYIMDFYDGASPSIEALTDEVVKCWGAVTGKMHRLTKGYDASRNLNASSPQFGYEDEIDDFIKMSRYDEVKTRFAALKAEMASWEKSRDCFGVIHNDNHQQNIFVSDGNVILTDFDCVNANFFAQDIFTSAQGLIFDATGGIDRPISDIDRLRRFYTTFLDGYETENHLDDIWLKRLGSFLRYRRLLLCTVLQGWLATNKSVRDGFMNTLDLNSDIFV